ncbi:hypothetical protein HYZ76_00005 [Candidatus Falkowbacteria bacterium]|nr:hypothetical protein [Candidatus Falkowbacteria bacterium]
MNKNMNKKLILLTALALFLGGFVTFASASHSWGKYHWDISTAESEISPLVFGDNLTTTTPEWGSSLSGASADWNLSVLKNQVVAGTNTACDPVLGQVEICNDTYGDNGWLGIAQIWVYRGKDGHIAQALVKVNDTYFNTATYNTSAWRNLVVCQEVGHTLGLDHQDENFDNPNLGTCMDYTSDPESNQHPNQHDYDELESKYAHLNGGEADKPGNGNGGNNGKKPAGVGADIDLNNPSNWGQVIRTDASGNPSLYVRNENSEYQVFTFVTWVQ